MLEKVFLPTFLALMDKHTVCANIGPNYPDTEEYVPDTRACRYKVELKFRGTANRDARPLWRNGVRREVASGRSGARVSTGQSVTVAVIDTGADTDRPNLRGRIAETATFVECGEPSFRAVRQDTALAGIIGARTGGTGFDGITPDARLNVFKACWYSDPTAAKAGAAVGRWRKRSITPSTTISR